MRTRLWIAAIMFPVVNAVLFGIGTVTLLSVPALAEHVNALFWMVVAASFLIAVPVSWFLAPRLRVRYWRKREGAA